MRLEELLASVCVHAEEHRDRREVVERVVRSGRVPVEEHELLAVEDEVRRVDVVVAEHQGSLAGGRVLGEHPPHGAADEGRHGERGGNPRPDRSDQLARVSRVRSGREREVVDAPQRASQHRDRHGARSWLAVERHERAVDDEGAEDRASRFVDVDQSRREARLCGVLQDVKPPAPIGDRLIVARHLQDERLARRLDAVNAGAREPRGDTRDRRGRPTEARGGQASRFTGHSGMRSARSTASPAARTTVVGRSSRPKIA